MIAQYGSKKREAGKVMLLCLLLVAIFFCIPHQAYADTSISDDPLLRACASDSSGYNFSPQSLTAPIVYCVKATIQNAVTSALQNLSDYFRGTIMAMFILAVTMHGAHLVSGERSVNGKSMVLMMKIVFVAYFSYNLGGFAGSIFDIMDELVGYAVGGYSPWAMIDSILGVLFGFAPGFALFQGLAWLGAGMVSDTPNFGMSSALLVAFIELILFIIEIVYIYLTSYIVVAFMLILSPMFIPMVIFQATERYFTQWLRTIIGAILVPVMLFALLYFALGLYTSSIKNIITAVLPQYIQNNPQFTLPIDPNNPPNPPDFSAFWKINQPFFAFNMGVDPNLINDEQLALGTTPGTTHLAPSSHVVINPYNRGGFDASSMSRPMVNFGSQNKSISQKLMLALIALWILTMVLKELIEKMPEIAQEIAHVQNTISLRAPKLREKIGEVKENFAVGGGTVIGGFAGGQLGAASGNRRVQIAGAIGGGIMGNMLGRKAISGK